MKKRIATLRKYYDGTLPIDNGMKYSMICHCVAVIHLIITFVFFFLSVPVMYAYNIFIAALYAYMGSTAIRKENYKLVYYISFTEILFHSILASVLIGWDWGFMIYTIALVPVSFYLAFTLPQIRQNLINPLIVGCIVFIFFVSTRVYCAHHTPVFPDVATKHFVTVYYCFNSLITFAMLLFFSILFVIEIKHMQQHLIQEKEALDSMATHDPLTQLLNRRSMEFHLSHAMNISDQNNTPFSVILGDIDDFKAVNDTYGHECGDRMLLHIADTIRSLLRTEDYSCRWGGEEFLLLIDGDGDLALQTAEAIRSAVEHSAIEQEGHRIGVTMTFGTAVYQSGCPVNKLIQHADENLYVGKRNGKNQVVS